MYIEKMDFLIFFALHGLTKHGQNYPNGQCQVVATKEIEGFQLVEPNQYQQSYAARMIAWQYQEDVVRYTKRLAQAASYFGNKIQAKSYFISKYPIQITDWENQLR